MVEATFRAVQYRRSHELDIELHFAWQPPYLQFRDLHNVVSEGEELLLKPVAPYGSDSVVAPVTATYFIGPTDGWMDWDSERACFRGNVPPRLASHVGAERFEVYTIPLELTARIVKRFTGNMLLERIIRVEVPLTVKRRPSRCSRPSPSPQPRRPHPFSNGFGNAPLVRTPLRRHRRHDLHCSLDFAEVCKLLDQKARGRTGVSPLRLHSLSLARLHDAIAIAHPPSSVTDVEVHAVHHISISNEKPEEGKPNASKRSPKLEDNDSQTTVLPEDHRSPKSFLRGDNTSTKSIDDSEECDRPYDNFTIPFRARPGNENLRIAPIPSPSPTVRMNKTRGEINLGSTHINGHGRLASQSESGADDDSSIASPPAKNITPPVADFFNSPIPSLKKKGKQRVLATTLVGESYASASRTPLTPYPDFNALHNAPGVGTHRPLSGPLAQRTGPMEVEDCTACYTCVLRDGKSQRFSPAGSPSLCRTCGSIKPYDSLTASSQWTSQAVMSSNQEEAIDRWQKRIRQNFQEFVESKEQENVDVNMENAFDSDKEEVSRFDDAIL